MNVCLIPARSGSKRLPGKNTKDFYGKPVIAYSIETAKQSGLFGPEGIWVSTDNEDSMRRCWHEMDVDAYVRSPETATDGATDYQVIDDYLWALGGDEDKYLCYFYPVAPMVTVRDLIQGYYMIRGPFNVVAVEGQFYWIDVEWFRGATEAEYYAETTLIPGIEYPDVNTAEDWEELRVAYAARVGCEY